MKKIISILGLIGLVFSLGFLKAQETELVYDANKLYIKYKNSCSVKVKNGPTKSVSLRSFSKINALQSKYGLNEQVLSMTFFDNQVLENTYRISFDSTKKIDLLIKELMEDPRVEYVEKVPAYYLFSTMDDPFYGVVDGENLRWHLDVIHAQEAWALQTASDKIKVAVVDNGVWTGHEDLQILPENQYNTVLNIRNCNPPEVLDNSKACTDISHCDIYDWSHGTHCAGLVGAINHNGKGIRSIGSGVSLMGVSTNSLRTSLITDAFEGIVWAAENGANVISCSWGGAGDNRTHNNILKSCYDKGIIVIFATGNAASSEPNFPAKSPYVISIGSVDSDRSPSSFTNHGNWVDLGAPGGYFIKDGKETKTMVLSTTFCKSQQYRLNNYHTFDSIHYDIMAGTSMATPLTAGLAGLLLSKNPDLTMPLLKSVLMQSGQEINSSRSTKSFNEDATVIDAKAALELLNKEISYPEKLSAKYIYAEDKVVISWNAPTQTDKKVNRYRLYRNRRLVDEYVINTTYTDIELPKGSYEYGIEAVYEDNSLSLRNGTSIDVGYMYTINTSVRPTGSGKVENSGPHPQFDTVKIKAVPNSGYTFVSWQYRNTEISNDTILEIYLKSDTLLTAVFKETIAIEGLEKKQNTLSVYPNPAKNTLYIESLEENFDFISIRNVSGKELIFINKPSTKQLSIESLTDGIYFIKARKGEKYYFDKFIKKQ